MNIQVNDFRWEPGKNDAEYIRLLESSRDEWQKIAQKAIAKLKTVPKPCEPRVMTLEEVLALGDNDFVYIETRLVGSNTKVKPAIYQPDNSSDDEGDGYCCIVSSWGESGFYHRENYNQSWRCWTSRPDEKRRAETPWE